MRARESDMACAARGDKEGADEARGGICWRSPSLLLAAMALKGALLALPSPPAAADGRRLRRQPRDGAAGAHPRRPAAASGRQRRRRRGARAADRRDARRRASTRASPTISPATASRAAAPSPARGSATSSRRSARPRAGICCSSRITIQHLRRAGRGRRRHRRRDDAGGRRRLLRGRRLARPVTFLFNEGEEMGLLGARAFLERDPLAGAGRHRWSTSRRAASPGRRSCSRPAGRTAPRSRSTAPPAPRPVGQFALDRPLPPDPQFDRRRRVRGAALDDPQLRGDRQRDPLSQRRRRLSPRSTGAASSIWASRRSAVDRARPRRARRRRRRASGSTPICRARADRAAAAVRAGPARPAAALLPGRRLAAARARPAAARHGGRRSPARRRSPSPAISSLGLIRAGDYWRAYPLVDDHRRLRLGARRLRRSPCCSSRGRPSGRGCAPPSGCSSCCSAAALCFVAPGAAIYFLLPPLARRARHGRASAGAPGPSRPARSPRRSCSTSPSARPSPCSRS